MDIVDKSTRSRMMSGIRSKDTKPEILIRHALHAIGFRYSKNSSQLSGKPDIYLKKHHAVIFIHGCFWHGHNCDQFKIPKTRRSFWLNKINANRVRDKKVLKNLKKQGLRTCIIWECCIRGKKSRNINLLINRISKWIYSDSISRQFK